MSGVIWVVFTQSLTYHLSPYTHCTHSSVTFDFVSKYGAARDLLFKHPLVFFSFLIIVDRYNLWHFFETYRIVTILLVTKINYVVKILDYQMYILFDLDLGVFGMFLI